MKAYNKLILIPLLFAMHYPFVHSRAEVPPTPQLLAVSVINDLGHVQLTWYQQDALSVTHYEINRWEDVYQLISVNAAEVNVTNDTVVWTDLDAVANTQRSMYQLISFIDSEQSQPSNEKPTIFQKESDGIDVCERKISLYWSEYGIGAPLNKYNIHFKAEGGSDQVIEILTSDLEIVDLSALAGNNSYRAPVYVYNLSGLSPAVNYQFWVEAIDGNMNGLTAFSNIRSNQIDAIPQPEPPVIDYVTVNEANEVEIYASINPLNTDTIRIERALDQNFTNEYFQFRLPVSHTIPLADNQAQTTARSYYYQLALLDQCSQAVVCPVVHRTILLEGNRTNTNTLNLNWNQYEGWAVNNYEVWRKQGEGEWEKIETLANNSTSTSDDLQLLPNKETALKYRIIAKGANNESHSNILQFQLDYTPLLPNAFNPLSSVFENTVFKPISDYYNSSGYNFAIYDRWNGLLWETGDPTKGWTGRESKGELYTRGVYIYQLTYVDQNGIKHQLNGAVTLIY